MTPAPKAIAEPSALRAVIRLALMTLCVMRVAPAL
jgi:hypothetical protein